MLDLSEVSEKWSEVLIDYLPVGQMLFMNPLAHLIHKHNPGNKAGTVILTNGEMEVEAAANQCRASHLKYVYGTSTLVKNALDQFNKSNADVLILTHKAASQGIAFKRDTVMLWPIPFLLPTKALERRDYNQAVLHQLRWRSRFGHTKLVLLTSDERYKSHSMRLQALAAMDIPEGKVTWDYSKP